MEELLGMKLSDLGLIFAMILICFATIRTIESAQTDRILSLNIAYNDAIDNAVTDALFMFVENDNGRQVSVNYDEAAKTFFKSLAINLYGDMPYGEDRIKEYVPALVFLKDDGMLVYHNVMDEKEGNMVILNKASELIEYTYSPFGEEYVICFSLSDNVKVIKDGETYEGLKEDIGEYLDIEILKDESEYEKIRKGVISATLRRTLERYVRMHNELMREMEGGFEFFIPEQEDSLWVRAVSQPGVMAVFEGFPYLKDGSLRFNKTAFGGARLKKGE